ncbi:hypothetical protein AD006_11070 [Pseudonocardia sp. EC080610-09]|nr:hypothetical protein FRP1_03460 [Pseudonocardia sp. EC080625-04]ALL75712.1 hypothetical protein AD006_11070 [Pseudonocardia sp. EC080610-09]ALL82739.1 hypothetical protein AD017_18900 [Pseudonocardia sp. EC080619-01]
MTTPSDDALVEFIAARPDLLRTLLAEHVATPGGDCRACPGPQSGRRRHPCDVRRAAERAASRSGDDAAPAGQRGPGGASHRRLR